jgi:integrase
MKMRPHHYVPLTTQAVEILREIRPLTGSGRFVFPGERDRSWATRNNTVNAALWRLAAESHLIRSRAPPSLRIGPGGVGSRAAPTAG